MDDSVQIVLPEYMFNFNQSSALAKCKWGKAFLLRTEGLFHIQYTLLGGYAGSADCKVVLKSSSKVRLSLN